MGTIYLQQASQDWNSKGVFEYKQINTMLDLAEQSLRQVVMNIRSIGKHDLILNMRGVFALQLNWKMKLTGRGIKPAFMPLCPAFHLEDPRKWLSLTAVSILEQAPSEKVDKGFSVLDAGVVSITAWYCYFQTDLADATTSF
jgi:hypothetical protein